jgi:predicted aspartyl protease
MEMRLPILSFLITLACFGMSARAQDCTPRLLATVKMNHAEPGSEIRTVPVSINGVEKQMVLDTGGAITHISRRTNAEMNLPLRRSGAKVFDINGRVSSRYTLVEKFGFGHLKRDKAALLVWPEPARPWAGLIAPDMLQPYDLDVDFAAGELKMYSKSCHRPPAWTRSASKIPMQNRGWHLHIPLTVDGKTYDGIFDTGSRNTIMRMPTARRDFGVSPDTHRMEHYPAINGVSFLDGYLHSFSKLSVGGIEVDNPQLLLVPDVMNRNADRSPLARSRAKRHNDGLVLPELTLGMNVMKNLRLYISFSEQALYVAPAVPEGKP